MLELSDQSPETLQQQIVRQVRSSVLSGEWAAGQALPSIRGLARQLRVSVITVGRAYEQLVTQGLIGARPGKGYYVSRLSSPQRTGLARECFRERLEQIVAAGLDDGLTPEGLRKELEAVLAKASRSAKEA